MNQQSIVVIGGVIYVAVALLFLQSSNNNERIFLVVLALIFGYGIFKYLQSTDLQTKKSQKTIQDITTTLQTHMIHLLDFKIKRPMIIVLNADKQLLKVLEELISFLYYDKDVITKILLHLMQFYDIYTQILLQPTKDNSLQQQITTLVDKRMELTQYVQYLFVAIPHKRHASRFEKINLVIQSSTYKCLNVIRNKYKSVYGLDKPPYAHNAIDVFPYA
jgi:hypothetical protein